ncbi:MAG: hypothetical protein ACYTG2_17705, partial [Planctomycetota bacterium]
SPPPPLSLRRALAPITIVEMTRLRDALEDPGNGDVLYDEVDDHWETWEWRNSLRGRLRAFLGTHPPLCDRIQNIEAVAHWEPSVRMLPEGWMFVRRPRRPGVGAPLG